MDFKQLEAFAHVVGLGSFSKAAEKLYLTQPTISAHISSLERELNAQLIVRTPKEAYPSETGKILYEYALDMLSLRDSAMLACRERQSNIGGVVNIAASTIPYQHVLPKMMSQFREKYPGVTFRLISSDSGGVVASIVEGRAELGMTGAMMDTSKCVYRAFADDYMVVIAPNTDKYQKLAQREFSLEGLSSHPLIIREPESGTRKETEAFLRSRGISLSQLNIAAQMDDPDAIKNSVSQGLGISIISRLACADYERFGLVQVLRLEGDCIARKLYLVQHKNRPLSPAAAAFTMFVGDSYSQLQLQEAGLETKP